MLKRSLAPFRVLVDVALPERLEPILHVPYARLRLEPARFQRPHLHALSKGGHDETDRGRYRRDGRAVPRENRPRRPRRVHRDRAVALLVLHEPEHVRGFDDAFQIIRRRRGELEAHRLRLGAVPYERTSGWS